VYERISSETFPMFYIAYRRNLSEGTEVVHNNLKARFEIGDQEVLDAMKRWAQITEEFRIALNEGSVKRMNELVNENFDLRRKIVRISKGNIEMVELARSVGASAKFTGSGGAVIGICENDLMFNKLKNKLNANGIEVIKPNIVNNTINLK